jgi:hypothetical protein
MNNVKFKEEKDALKTLFMSNVMKAKHRNNGIREVLKSTKVYIDEFVTFKDRPTRQFEKLEKNYMEYIRSVYPEWTKELEEYEKKRNTKRITTRSQSPKKLDTTAKSIGNLPKTNNEENSKKIRQNLVIQ